MASHSRVEVTGPAGSEGVTDEVMAELKKEIARNVEATKLVKQREMEATHARDKAADSQRRMQEMMDKYDEMKHKLEWTRVTLAETHSRLEKHNNSRSERLRQSVMELKEKAEQTQQRLLARSQGTAGPDGPTESDLADADAMGAALGGLGGLSSCSAEGGLTDAERMLLQLCQEQRMVESVIEPEEQEQQPQEAEEQMEPSQRLKNASRDYAKTVMDLQKKLSSSSKPAASSPKDSGSQEDVSNCQAVSSSIESSSSSTNDKSPEPVSDQAAAVEEPRLENTADYDSAPPKSVETAVEIATEIAAATEPPSEEVSKLAAAAVEADQIADLNVAMVAQMEAKVASVRETLGEMAMSEQYMRTKRAQLLARTREREAQLAMQLATEKEKEAAEMRQKVKHMMLLLDERRNKLRATVDVLQKKSGVVEKVNKLLDSKERRANYVEKQRDEVLAFDKKQKKN